MVVIWEGVPDGKPGPAPGFPSGKEYGRASSLGFGAAFGAE